MSVMRYIKYQRKSYKNLIKPNGIIYKLNTD